MSRRVAVALVMFFACTIGILAALEEIFLRALFKGAIVSVFLIPLANSYYVD